MSGGIDVPGSHKPARLDVHTLTHRLEMLLKSVTHAVSRYGWGGCFSHRTGCPRPVGMSDRHHLGLNDTGCCVYFDCVRTVSRPFFASLPQACRLFILNVFQDLSDRHGARDAKATMS